MPDTGACASGRWNGIALPGQHWLFGVVVLLLPVIIAHGATALMQLCVS